MCYLSNFAYLTSVHSKVQTKTCSYLSVIQLCLWLSARQVWFYFTFKEISMLKKECEIKSRNLHSGTNWFCNRCFIGVELLAMSRIVLIMVFISLSICWAPTQVLTLVTASYLHCPEWCLTLLLPMVFQSACAARTCHSSAVLWETLS